MQYTDLVTIIIPVYNVRPYLCRCIDSVVQQTYKNLDVIIVDDGSTDGCAEILESKYADYPFVRIIHQQNSGLSQSRNVAMQLMQGNYCLFLDGDDWLDIDCVEKLLAEKEPDTDILLFPYIREYSHKCYKTKIFPVATKIEGEALKENYLKRLIGPTDRLLHEPESLNRLNTAWGKLYKAELIKKISFVDTKLIGPEDCLFNIQVAVHVKAIMYTESTFYHYNKQNSISLTKSYKKQFKTQRQTFYKMVEGILKKQGYDTSYWQALTNRIVLEVIELILNVVISNLSFLDKYKEVRSLLHDEKYSGYYKTFPLHELPFMWRIIYFAIKRKLTLFVLCSVIFANSLRRHVK